MQWIFSQLQGTFPQLQWTFCANIEADTNKNNTIVYIVMTNRMDNLHILSQEIESHNKVISILKHWKEYLHINTTIEAYVYH